MKHFLFAALLLLAAFTAGAQNHITYLVNGIPVTDTLVGDDSLDNMYLTIPFNQAFNTTGAALTQDDSLACYAASTGNSLVQDALATADSVGHYYDCSGVSGLQVKYTYAVLQGYGEAMAKYFNHLLLLKIQPILQQPKYKQLAYHLALLDVAAAQGAGAKVEQGKRMIDRYTKQHNHFQ